MRRQSPAPGTHYASTNLRNALHHSSSNSVLYPVSTPLASLQKHQPGAAGGIIRHERTSNPPVQVSFVPRESADLDEGDEDSGDLSDDLSLDANHNDVRHISTIKIGSSSEGLQKFSPTQTPKKFTSRIDAVWGSDVERGDQVDHARNKGGYAVGGLRGGGFEKKHGTESRGERGWAGWIHSYFWFFVAPGSADLETFSYLVPLPPFSPARNLTLAVSAS